MAGTSSAPWGLGDKSSLKRGDEHLTCSTWAPGTHGDPVASGRRCFRAKFGWTWCHWNEPDAVRSPRSTHLLQGGKGWLGKVCSGFGSNPDDEKTSLSSPTSFSGPQIAIGVSSFRRCTGCWRESWPSLQTAEGNFYPLWSQCILVQILTVPEMKLENAVGGGLRRKGEAWWAGWDLCQNGPWWSSPSYPQPQVQRVAQARSSKSVLINEWLHE